MVMFKDKLDKILEDIDPMDDTEDEPELFIVPCVICGRPVEVDPDTDGVITCSKECAMKL